MGLALDGDGVSLSIVFRPLLKEQLYAFVEVIRGHEVRDYAYALHEDGAVFACAGGAPWLGGFGRRFLLGFL